MAKLRHLAIVVKDMEASARFYEKIFDMKRAYEVKDRAIYLTALEKGRSAEEAGEVLAVRDIAELWAFLSPIVFAERLGEVE